MFKYRITPHSTTGVAPAELLMGRRLRSRLDLLKPSVAATVEDNQLKQMLRRDGSREFSEGALVYVQDFTASKQKWIPGTIRKITGPVSYIVLLTNGSTVRRHVDNIKARFTNNTTEEDNTDYSTLQPKVIEIPAENATPATTCTSDNATVPELVISTRPSRDRRPPKRFNDFVATTEVTDL